MQVPSRPKILIADDHALVAEGIAQLLSVKYDVVGVARSGLEAIDMTRDLGPDLVCLDMSMPGMNGIQVAVKLSAQSPKLKIIFITQQLSLPYLRAAFHAGGSGYVCKQSAGSEVLDAVRRVLAGRQYITPLAKVENITPAELQRAPEKAFTDALTDRQRQVLKSIAEGHTTKEIAAELNISIKTVEFHRSCLLNELE